jgi:2-polyprenyl-3-methyl-5-hydroxy-6-metoxy-1,4-benzoquinol methylase
MTGKSSSPDCVSSWMLAETCKVTGSDLSEVFLKLYWKDHPHADTLLLDAVTINTDRTFDCIYSNKVLHHLSADDLQKSLER